MIRVLSRWCCRFRFLVLGLWALMLAGAIAFSTMTTAEQAPDYVIPGSEAEQAAEALSDAGLGAWTGEQAQVVFQTRDVTAPDVRRRIQRLLGDISAAVEGVRVASPYEAGGQSQISRDRRTGYAELQLSDRPQEQLTGAAEHILAAIDRAQGPYLKIAVGGSDIFAQEDEFSNEIFGMIAAIVILLIAFGSLLAMTLPILNTMLGVGTGVSTMLLVSAAVAMPEYTVYAAVMVGVGVGIDYALFVVTRFREGLQEGLAVEPAVAGAMNTAGRAVLFAGLTVVASLLGLLFFGMDAISGTAIGIAVAVACVVLASLTLLPALLSIVGRHIDRFGLPHRHRALGGSESSVWSRLARRVQRRPWIALTGSLLVLAMLSVPVFSIRLGFTGAENRAPSDPTRQAQEMLTEGFGPGLTGPLILVASGADAQQALTNVRQQVSADHGVAGVSPPFGRGTVAVMQVTPTTGPQEVATADLVHRLREVVGDGRAGGASVYVAGATAAAIDYAEYTLDQMPIVVGAVLVLCFALILLIFRSPLVALKAVVVNLLSIGAAYGFLVVVFQWGWGLDLLGVAETGPIEAWVPMVMFVLIFGLSMDYEVFLMSRVREEWDRTRRSGHAVVQGLSVTARVITAAAAIMIAVFGGFALSQDRALQILGLGLAMGVLIDATLVRLILVPATMRILGDRAWALPRRLERVLPRFQVESPAAAHTPVG